ncbi:RDD family protein [Saccharopolyspora karakumensis]|uniref:RDD family protein n=1 Tax=Saccharopolyspora karakumensis TaxID=2530386 RepID=A0A4R5C641_9PSEU|nr:RDD family protein [Saccharopolyspora karakumensis]TDD92362.1 RDD family protein [Saccharopolyspora karakumensis]
MNYPYGGPPSGPQQPYGGPPSGPQPQQPFGPPSGPQPQQPYPPQQGYAQQYPPQPYGAPGAHPAGQLAEWGTRVLGYLIDGAIPGAAYVILYIVMMSVIAGTASTGSESGMETVGIIVLIVGLLAYLALAAFTIWNLCYRRGTTGQTLGQKVAKIKTVGEATGQPIGFGNAFLRQICHIVDSAICGLPIGWLAPLWDEKKQTWADKIVKTVVVVVPDVQQVPQAPGYGQPPQPGYGQPQQW